jgi:hypothetical protein
MNKVGTDGQSAPIPEVVRLLAELEMLLHDEQRAVAAYDVATLEKICETKDDVMARLRSAPACQDAGMVRGAARRVTAMAEANAAMFSASVAAVGEALGLRTTASTYDARARLSNRMSSVTARVL